MNNSGFTKYTMGSSSCGGKIVLYCLVLIVSLCSATRSVAQGSGGFDLQSAPNVDFVFNTFEKYENGIIIPHVLELNVNVVGAQWDLYMGTTTTTPGSWNELSTYSNVGTSPIPVGLLQARVYDIGGTTQTGGTFFPVSDVATPVYIIGSNIDDPAVSCGSAGANEPGDYLTSPSCYKINVDLKIDPGFNYRPGLYTLRVDFYIIEDL
jgi:hypothetical protein